MRTSEPFLPEGMKVERDVLGAFVRVASAQRSEFEAAVLSQADR
jgi:hypothetical protein